MKKACLLFALMITTSLFAQDYQGRLDDFFSSEIGKFKIPNVDISIVNDSEIFYSKSYGEKRSHNSLHYIGSVSKSLTAIGVLKLIEGKKLDFKQKLSDIIPNIKYNEYSRNITIRNLLNHTSGISKRSGFSNLPSLPELNTTNYSLEVKREPGKVYEYSNLNYSLLGLVIEQISGVPFSDFMLANIFKPLNMNSSKIFLHRQENDEIIKQYQYWGNFPIRSKQVNYETTSIPAGFILSNAEDLSKYLAMMLTNVGDKPERFLEPRLISEMLTPWDNSEFG